MHHRDCVFQPFLTRPHCFASHVNIFKLIIIFVGCVISFLHSANKQELTSPVGQSPPFLMVSLHPSRQSISPPLVSRPPLGKRWEMGDRRCEQQGGTLNYKNVRNIQKCVSYHQTTSHSIKIPETAWHVFFGLHAIDSVAYWRKWWQGAQLCIPVLGYAALSYIYLSIQYLYSVIWTHLCTFLYSYLSICTLCCIICARLTTCIL